MLEFSGHVGARVRATSILRGDGRPGFHAARCVLYTHRALQFRGERRRDEGMSPGEILAKQQLTCCAHKTHLPGITSLSRAVRKVCGQHSRQLQLPIVPTPHKSPRPPTTPTPGTDPIFLKITIDPLNLRTRHPLLSAPPLIPRA